MQRIASPETFHSTLSNAALLVDRGIPIAVTSSFEGYVPKSRVALYEAAIAAVNGLGYDRALRSVTIDAARILGIDRDYGSIERGKVADLVLFDADPIEYTSHVTHVVVDGQLVYDRSAAAEQRSMAASGSIDEWHCCDFR
jgi:imidazolonepropionase-like amidohydrolase